MKIGAFLTITNPIERGDLYNECLAMANDCFDIVTVIDGKDTWPREFSWELIGKHFQKGYEQTDADYVFHLDLDFMFHEKDFDKIRKACEDNPEAPALSFYKWQFTLPDRYNLKSRLVLAVNKKRFGDRIRFDSGGDLCQPSLDGKYISPDDVPESRIEFYNYEKLLKTEVQIKDDVERMARAWKTFFGNNHLGTDETAYAEWLEMSKGRFDKPQEHIPLGAHPKYVQETIRNLAPWNWGYEGHGHLQKNDYVGL